MSGCKYPYIPKEYYPAVMFACSCIRKYRTFNAACAAAAHKYGVDVDEIKKHVRARQGAGQRGTTRIYKYYAVWGYSDQWCTDGDQNFVLSQYDPIEWARSKEIHAYVFRATSVDNMKKQIPNGKYDRSNGMHYGYCLTHCRWKEFDTMKQAEEWLERDEWTMEDDKNG